MRGAHYSRRPHWSTPLFVESHEDLLQLDHHLTFHSAEAHAVMGDSARSLDLMESAMRRGFHPYAFMARYDPLVDSLRAEPRFAQRVLEAKRRWEAFRP